MITNFLKTKQGRIIISCILGLGLASLFRKVCTDNNCLIINSPSDDAINNKVFKYNNQCYKYTKKDAQCNN